MNLLIILTILVIVWMIVIFLLSNSPSDESSKLSNKTMDLTVVKVFKLFKTKKSSESIRSKYSTLVRKSAHFTEYMILGILSYLVLKGFEIDNPLLVILLCFLYAVTDEIHQYFVPGRSCRVFDVMIDTIGSLVGVLIVYFLK